MIAAIPVLTNTNDAAMSAHFGSAPFLAVVDSDTGGIEFIDRSAKDEHQCAPTDLLVEKSVSTVLCSGIGAGAVNRFRSAGIQCLCVEDSTLTLPEIIKGLSSNTLNLSGDPVACAGHEHGGGCH